MVNKSALNGQNIAKKTSKSNQPWSLHYNLNAELLFTDGSVGGQSSLILPLKKTSCSFYVNRSMPHLLKQKKKNRKRERSIPLERYCLLCKKVRYVTGSEGSELKDYKLRGMTVSEEPEMQGMRHLVAKRQRKIANRHDLFHLHDRNKRRLDKGVHYLDRLLV